MAAAAAGIHKQVTVAVMEPCIRHGRGANAHTVKVGTLSMSLKSTLLTVVLFLFVVSPPLEAARWCVFAFGG